jgi:hypothetical protein
MTEPQDRTPFPAPFPAPGGAHRLPDTTAEAVVPAWPVSEPSELEEKPEPRRNRGALMAIIAGCAVFAAVATVVVIVAVREPAHEETAAPQQLYAPIVTTSSSSGKLTTVPGATTTSASTPATTTTSVTAPTSTVPPSTVPASTRRVTGPKGISVEIPADWPVKPGVVPSNMQADSPLVTGDLLRYGGSTSPAMTLLASIVEQETKNPNIRLGYQRLQLTEISPNVVLWEFLFRKDGVDRHAMGRFWRLNRVDYVVYVSSSVDSWPSMQEVFDVLARTAKPQ